MRLKPDQDIILNGEEDGVLAEIALGDYISFYNYDIPTEHSIIFGFGLGFNYKLSKDFDFLSKLSYTILTNDDLGYYLVTFGAKYKF